MKLVAGTIGGFIFGMAGFLALFKAAILDRIPPSDELAPGIVVLIAIFCGALCAVAGQSIQRRLKSSSSSAESE